MEIAMGEMAMEIAMEIAYWRRWFWRSLWGRWLWRSLVGGDRSGAGRCSNGGGMRWEGRAAYDSCDVRPRCGMGGDGMLRTAYQRRRKCEENRQRNLRAWEGKAGKGRKVGRWEKMGVRGDMPGRRGRGEARVAGVGT